MGSIDKKSTRKDWLRACVVFDFEAGEKMERCVMRRWSQQGARAGLDGEGSADLGTAWERLRVMSEA